MSFPVCMLIWRLSKAALACVFPKFKVISLADHYPYKMPKHSAPSGPFSTRPNRGVVGGANLQPGTAEVCEPPKYRANIMPAISVRTTHKPLLVGGMSVIRRR